MNRRRLFSLLFASIGVTHSQPIQRDLDTFHDDLYKHQNRELFEAMDLSSRKDMTAVMEIHFNMKALDAKSVDSWLECGGGLRIAQAIIRHVQRMRS